MSIKWLKKWGDGRYVHIAVLWHCKMMSLISKSADWPPPNCHKIARTFPKISWAPQINEYADSKRASKKVILEQHSSVRRNESTTLKTVIHSNPKRAHKFYWLFYGDMVFTSVLSELALKWFRCSSQIHHDLPETGAISSTYCLTISKQFTTINHVLLPDSCALLIRFFIPLN